MTNDTIEQTIAQRISRSATIELNRPIDEVFPLFEPVREKLWAPGWEPEIIYPLNQTVARQMIFTTTPRFDDEGRYHWIITAYDPASFNIEYTVSTRECVWFITVQCVAAGQLTKATVTYTYTGLTARGCVLNKQAMQDMFSSELKDWEQAINYYLENGEKIKP